MQETREAKTAREARMVEKSMFDQYLLACADGVSSAALISGLALAFARITDKPENLKALYEAAKLAQARRKGRPYTTPHDPLIRTVNLRKAV